MSTLEERIREVMHVTGMDERTIAKACGVTPSAVYQWLGHGSKPINSIGDIEVATKLMHATGFCALWISKGKGPKLAADAPHHPPIDKHMIGAHATNSKMAPVIEWASLGVDLSKPNKELKSDLVLSIPADANDRCKWVNVDSDYQSFRIKKGDKIAVDPVFEINSIDDGTLCLFISIKGAFFIAEFRAISEGSYEALKSDGAVLDRVRHGVQIAGVVRGTWRG
jgi:hypothetical protein